QGVPSVVSTVMHLDSVPVKKRNDVKKSLLSFIQHFFPSETKLYCGSESQDALTILRTICTQTPKEISWRDTHPYLLAEDVSFIANDDNENIGTLRVSGYARGVPFSANRLVHLQNYGDFQLKEISSCPTTREDTEEMAMDAKTLETTDPALQDSLVAENEPDLMQNEQTWPTREELDKADQSMSVESDNLPDAKPGTTPKRIVKRVPKGTSAYQAAWIVDSEDEYSEEDDDEDETMACDDDQEEESSIKQIEEEDDEEEEYEEIELETRNPVPSDQMDEDEEKQLQEYLETRKKENREDLQFPDEVDTPMDISARVRFQRYRGLESFRTSPWDPYENLPIDYARIFQFADYKRTLKRVTAEALIGAAKPGMRITLHISNVPKEVKESFDPSRPFIIFGLLQYEHRISVLNFVLTRTSHYTEPIKSKDPLLIQCGFRRYTIHPLFSQHTHSRKGTNNVHKFEKFLNAGRTSIATIYGPIVFGAMPCLAFKDTGDINDSILVATGSSNGVEPTRIIAKRIILTGYPLKINKRSAVIRYMFFNPEDVQWFKPVRLHSKYGRTGHIKESLGTHGHMKCVFDSPIKQQDTVMMYLYKRVYPKWGTTEIWKGGLEDKIIEDEIRERKMEM
ncbi:8071_t:CDS:10, partial [Paraglomus occultum]